MEFILKSAPLAVGAGAVELAGVYLNRLRVFGEVLKDRRRFMKLCQSSKYKEEYRCAYIVKRSTV